MNVLIIGSKSDSKVYRQIIEKAPDIKVLGALHKVDKHTYKAVVERYLPHILLIDDRSIKQKTDLFEILAKLRRKVPNLKIIIISDNQLYRRLSAFAMVDGLLSDTVLLDMLKIAAEQYGNPDYTYDYLSKNIIEKRIIKENRAVPKFYKIAVFSSAGILAIVLAAVILSNSETDSSSELPTHKAISSTISSSKLSKINTSVSATISPKNSNTDETVKVIQFSEKTSTDTKTSLNTVKKPSATSKSKVLPSSVYKPTEPKPLITSPENSAFSKQQPTSKTKTTKPVKQTTLKTPSATNPKKSKSTTNKPQKKSKARKTTKPRTTAPSTKFTKPVITATTKEFKNSGQKDVIIKLSYSSKTLYDAESFTLNAKVDNSSDKVVWSTSNKKVATVSGTGYVKAYSVGTATITAQIGSSKAECEVTVIPRSR